MKYIKGESNVVADALSRLPKAEEHEEELNYFGQNTEETEQRKEYKHHFGEHCFLNRRVYEEQTICPIRFKQIQYGQREDATIRKLQTG